MRIMFHLFRVLYLPPLLLVLTFLLVMSTWVEAAQTGSMLVPKQIRLISGKSMVLRNSRPIKRVSVAAPEVADIVMLSAREIYITGKSAGTTNLTLWENGSVSAVYDLEVVYDLSRLKQQIHQLLPHETALQIIGTYDSITLAGKVSSTADLSKVITLARAYAPKGKINNLVEVGGIHQVMLEVRVAEMARSTTRRLGINFNYFEHDGEFGVGLLAGLSQLASGDDANLSGSSDFGLNVSPAVNALFRFHNNGGTWTGLIDALKEDGLVKILAEPTLLALSGRQADFLAGGEFPVPVPQGLGSVAIEYKDFGVGLSFTPTVLNADRISIEVTPEVSELDFSTAVQFSGFVVPGITTRKASTTIELSDGQSFAIAGLLKETIRDSVQKFPFLGDIPILGLLFRSHSFLKNETELVIIVTPHLVKPLVADAIPLPTDGYVEPTDTEFYLFGLMQGDEKRAPQAPVGQMEGALGHAPAGTVSTADRSKQR